MVFTTAGGGATQETGYEISNSLRFNDADTPSLTLDLSGGAGNRKTWTASFWFKLGNMDSSGVSNQRFLSANTSHSDANYGQIGLGSGDYLEFGTGTQLWRRTNRLFRDPSAWYHIVVAMDTTQGTASNRVKIYINGVQETSFAISNDPTQDADYGIMGAVSHAIGKTEVSGQTDNETFDGYMAEWHFIDGSALAETEFGETNDNGVWIPKRFTGSFGSNGFKLEFKQTGTGTASASTIGADTSGNTNHLTSTNLAATDIAEDTPTNNFMTGNPLAIINGSEAPTRIPDYSEGNTVATASNGTTRYLLGTFATSMPYYFEVKVLSTSSTDSSQRIGIIDAEAISNATTYNVAYQADGVITATGESNATGKQSITADDIIGVAVDLATNNNVKLYHNGTLQATMSVGSSYQSLLTTPFARLVDATQSFSFNFGNPSFAISSGNADGLYGNFEYAPPSGYYALCTKRLAEYG